MKPDDLIPLFSKLSGHQKSVFWCLIGHEITIFARESYPRGGQLGDIEKLVVFNELLHLITSQLRHQLMDDAKRYSDDGFIEIIWAQAIKAGFENEIALAFQSAMRQF